MLFRDEFLRIHATLEAALRKSSRLQDRVGAIKSPDDARVELRAIEKLADEIDLALVAANNAIDAATC